MDGKEGVPQSEGPPRPALITPSASPPIFRPLSLATSLDRSPPTKRRRLGSTPSSPLPLSTPTASSVDPFDIYETRKASFQRLLSTWSSLAERYNRPLDEDDIIDLRDGSVVKDRGFLRNAKKFDFASDDVPSDVNDASSDYGGVQTDDDVDELDAFAPGADISGGLELEREKLLVLPMREGDPADAEDLRQFLEAERLRKEQYGDEEDEEEVVKLMTTSNPRSSTSSLLRQASPDTSMRGRDDRPEEVPILGDDMDGKDDLDDTPRRPASTSLAEPLHCDDSSDDEFATWDFDTTTPVKSTKPQRPATPDDVIDLTDSPPSSPSRASSPCGRSRDPVHLVNGETQSVRAQSQPRGRPQTSARINAVGKNAPQASTRVNNSARSKTAARRKNSMPPPPLPSASAAQLVTPPPSSSSVIDSTPESATGFVPRSPSPSLPPSPPPLPRPKPRPRFKGSLQTLGGSNTESPQPAPGPQSTVPEANAKTPKASRFRLVPEVVITDRPRAHAVPSRAASSRPDADKRILGQTNTGQPHNSDGPSRKDISKATKDSDDRRCIGPGEGAQKGVLVAPKQASSTKRIGTEDTAPIVDQEDSEDEIPLRVKLRKRKRVLSSSSLSGTSDKDESFPTITPIVPSRTHSQAPPKDVPGPSSSSRTPGPTRRNTAVDDDDSDDAGPEPPPPLPPPRARTPYKPIPPKLKEYHHVAAPPAPHTPQHHNTYNPYPPGVFHDPDAQMRFAQAAHYLSYIMGAAASLPHPPGYPPGYPPLPFPVQTPQWPPWTPTHRSHRSQQDRQSGLSSPDAGPSGSWSYNTPSHSHPYPFTFNPAYSSASLPPSSPPASSEPPSPIVRSSSLARGRSKSRGRRVSFKLDSSKRPILPSPPRFDHDDASDDAAAGGSRQVQAHGDTSEQPATRPKAQSRVSGRAGTPAVKPDKGKARADHAEDSDGSDRGRGRRRERGRTPGPPAHSERSASARAAGRKT